MSHSKRNRISFFGPDSSSGVRLERLGDNVSFNVYSTLFLKEVEEYLLDKTLVDSALLVSAYTRSL
jgi:hypothetical protein